MTGDPAYVDRESIQPRAFAVRHLIIQEVKFRKGQSPDATTRERLDRVARGVEVEYDTRAHCFVLCCEGVERRRLPLDAFTLYFRGDSQHSTQRCDGDPRHWDVALEENRRLVATLVREMAAALAPRAGP